MQKQISDVDARDFLRALDHNVVKVDGGGRFRMPRSCVNEVIFWEHPAKVSPRPISLWIEPVITIAAVARLQNGWAHSADEILTLRAKLWREKEFSGV